MSIHQSKHVWEDPFIERAEILDLLAIADQANDAGIAWISQEKLAHRTRQTPRNLRYNLKQLTNPKGPVSPRLWIYKKGAVKGSNLYILNLPISYLCDQCRDARALFIHESPPDWMETSAWVQISSFFSEQLACHPPDTRLHARAPNRKSMVYA